MRHRLHRRWTRRYKTLLRVILPVLFLCVLLASYLMAPSANQSGFSAFSLEPEQLIDNADKMMAGNIRLALAQLRDAVRMAPTNGEARAKLGRVLLLSGQAVAAERELRQAINPTESNSPPLDMVIPSLLKVMLARNEVKELLAEFPDPAQGTQDKTAADILRARAFALQRLDQPKEARTAMDRSLSLRRDVDGLIQSASLAQEHGDLELARSQADEAMKLSPTDEDPFSFSVWLALQRGDAQKALTSAEDYVQRFPRSSRAKIRRIQALLDLNEDPRAKQDVDALFKTGSPYGAFFRGVLLARAADPQAAWLQVQFLRPEFVQLQPTVALMVSSIAAASGHDRTASAILTTFIARNPNNRFARLQLAAIFLSQNAAQAAVDALTPIKMPNDLAVHALLARGYLGLERFDEAIASLEIASPPPKAHNLLRPQLAFWESPVDTSNQAIQRLRALVKQEPSNEAAAIALITSLIATSKWDEASAVADEMANQAPQSPFPAFYQGQILVARGNLVEAEAVFREALGMDPKFVPALYYRANVRVALGDTENAKADLQLLLARDPTISFANIRLAEIASHNGRDQEALALLDRSIKAAPRNPAPRLAQANYQIARGNCQDARATMSGLLQVSPDHPEGRALEGQIQLRCGQVADAIHTFQKLATDSAASPGAYALLARALYASKDQHGAEEAAKKAIELAPHSAQMRVDLIDIQVGGGNGENVLAAVRNYANENPGPEADLLLANALFRLKRTNEAETLLEKSLSAKPDSRVAVRLSQIAMNSGNFKKADAVLANWIAKNPNDFVTRREYDALLRSVDSTRTPKVH